MDIMQSLLAALGLGTGVKSDIATPEGVMPVQSGLMGDAQWQQYVAPKLNGNGAKRAAQPLKDPAGQQTGGAAQQPAPSAAPVLPAGVESSPWFQDVMGGRK